MSRVKTMHVFLFFFLSINILFLAPQMVRAQEGDDDEQSEELKRLNAIKAEAEARKAIAEAKAAELKARFPKANSTPLEGKTTAEDAPIEETLVGYVSVGAAADKIAQSLYRNQPGIKKIAVYNDADVKLLVTYSASIKRVQTFKQRYLDLIAKQKQALRDTDHPMPPLRCNDNKGAPAVNDIGGAGLGAVLGAGTSVIGGFTDLLSFLRTDVEIKGSTFDVAESVIVSEVFRALRVSYARQGIELYYPGEFPPNFDPMKDSPMLNEIEGVYRSKDEADDLAARINARIAQRNKRIADLDICIGVTNTKIGEVTGNASLSEGEKAAQIAQLKLDISQFQHDKEPVQNDISTLQQALRSQPNLNAQLELLVKDMVKVDDKTGINPLTAFIQSENLQMLMKDDQSYWLKLKVVKAGGNTRIKRNLIVDVFTFGNRISYNGASTIEYHLYDNKGRSIASDTITKYFDFIKGKRVEALSDNYDQR
jgi:hypothetical protein